jgi:hypothetical protein
VPTVGEPSGTELLSLHGVRVLGSGTAERVAALYDLDADEVREYLLDAEAYGWVTRYDAGRALGPATLGITDRGRAENERQLAAELDRTGTGPAVREAHAAFLPLNRRLGEACTRWQIRPVPWDRMAVNDHTDRRWDDAVIDELVVIGRRLTAVVDLLTAVLTRFGVHVPRYLAAVAKVEQGAPDWIDAPDRPSCHLVWIQLHEDLLATLGLERGSDG